MTGRPRTKRKRRSQEEHVPRTTRKSSTKETQTSQEEVIRESVVEAETIVPEVPVQSPDQRDTKELTEEQEVEKELERLGNELWQRLLSPANWECKSVTGGKKEDFVFQCPKMVEGKKTWVEGSTKFSGYSAIAKKYKELGEEKFEKMIKGQPEKVDQFLEAQNLNSLPENLSELSPVPESHAEPDQSVRTAVAVGPSDHQQESVRHDSASELPTHDIANSTASRGGLHPGEESGFPAFFSVMNPDADDLIQNCNDHSQPIKMDFSDKIVVAKRELAKAEGFFLGQTREGAIIPRMKFLEDAVGIEHVAKEHAADRMDRLKGVWRRISKMDDPSIHVNQLLEKWEMEVFGESYNNSGKTVLSRLEGLESGLPYHFDE